MKVTTTVELGIRAKAVWENDSLKLSASVSAPYQSSVGERQAIAIINQFPPEIEEKFAEAFEALMGEVTVHAAKAAEFARSEAVGAAARKGEL